MNIRVRAYLDSRPSIQAKDLKPYVGKYGLELILTHDKNYPTHCKVTDDEHFASVLMFANTEYDYFPAPLVWDNTRYPRVIFVCPCCTKKRLRLYGAVNGWACRECLGLSYRCQSEAPLERLTRATRKQRMQIWGEKADQDLLSASYPIKPKGRHAAKFARDFKRSDKVETRRLELLSQKINRMMAQLNKPYAA